MRDKDGNEIGLTPGRKRYWHNRGVHDARMSLSETNIDNLLRASANYWHPSHFSDAKKYYLLGFRRTGRRILKREYYQRAGIVG